MAKGLRIHHPTESDVILLVPVPAMRPDLGGIPVDMHIHLDENGDSIVSEGVWSELIRAKESGLSSHEFVILNEVPNPPTIVSGPGMTAAKVKRTLKETTPGTIHDSELQAIAQQFAPRGFKTEITTKKKDSL